MEINLNSPPNLLPASKQKGGKSHNRFDMPKRRFNRIFALAINRLAGCRIQLLTHLAQLFFIGMSRNASTVLVGRTKTEIRSKRCSFDSGKSAAVLYPCAFEDERKPTLLLLHRCSNRAFRHRQNCLCESHPRLCRAAEPDTRDPECRRQSHGPASPLGSHRNCIRNRRCILELFRKCSLRSAEPSAKAARHLKPDRLHRQQQ